MKTPKLLGEIEDAAARQLTTLLRAGRKQYDRFMTSAGKVSDKTAQRRYIRAAEQTIDAAEEIIAQMRKRIKAARKSLTGPAKKKRKTKPSAKKTVKRPARRALKKRKTRH